MPAIAVIILSFIAIIGLMRLKVPLSGSIVGGILVVAIAARQSVAASANGLWETIADPQTISLLVIIALILLLSDELDASGRLHEIVDKFQRILKSRRLRLAAFPALIGLLPMPGGAVFSAPMVKEAGRPFNLRPYELASINYWFRHIWEYWWPLYPGVILTIGVTGLSLPLFMAAMFPFTLVAVAIGTLTLFGGLRREDGQSARENQHGNPQAGPGSAQANTLGAALLTLWPILIVVIGGVGLEMAREFAEGAGYEFHLPLPRFAIIAALLVVCALLAVIDRATLPRALKAWGCYRNIEMLLMVVAVFWYKLILEQTALVTGTVGDLAAWQVPLALVLLILPFFAGMITGILVAGIGVSLPICIGLAESAGIPVLPAAVFAYAAAFMGVMASPIHFCFILTKEYFRASFAPMYRLVTPGIVVVLVFAALLAMLYAGLMR